MITRPFDVFFSFYFFHLVPVTQDFSSHAGMVGSVGPLGVQTTYSQWRGIIRMIRFPGF